MYLCFCSCSSSEDKRAAAEKDIWRLKSNWLFAMFASSLRVINYTCVIPTNHQFIINPTAETLNITDEKVEPGLQQSETFYSLTYEALFATHVIAAVATGLLFNLIPAWYLFLVSTLCHTLGYLLYALATNGWMIILARGLAGLQTGSTDSLVFAYYSVSFEQYAENLKTLGKFEETKAKKLKGYLFSSVSIAYIGGYGLGVGFPAILAQFPDIPQFRAAGWFCVAAGVAVLLLQLVLFHGECAWNCSSRPTEKKRMPSFEKDEPCRVQFCRIFAPLYVILTGGLKGVRYILVEVLLNPIISDSFGFSVKDSALFFLILFTTAPVVSTTLLYFLQYLKFRGYGLAVLGLMCTTTSLLIMTDWQAIGSDQCTEYSLFHRPGLADQYRLQLAEANVSESGMVSVQSLQVVEGEVYQMAVNRCESAGEQCHWIPNSPVTGKHCSDCQPICRSTQHTLNFAQFIVGIALFFSTPSLLYSGTFLLLSELVSRKYQGVSAGSMVALEGIARSAFPLILDAVYESEQKSTYLSMLIQVGIFLPLLVGLLLLYPWLGGSHKIQYSLEDRQKMDPPHQN